MESSFELDERLYRAVFPPGHPGMFWKIDGSLSPAAFADPKGLSVDRDYNRSDAEVVTDMKKHLKGRIIYVTVDGCNAAEAIVLYRPSRDNMYHSEIHGCVEVHDSHKVIS